MTTLASGRTMRVARLHNIGEAMRVEEVPYPTAGPTDVIVKVEACNLVPNLHNVLENWENWFPYLPLPKRPAIFGLDTAGVIDAVGPQVQNFKVGDRVYVNPGVSCGSCKQCLRGNPIDCDDYTFLGYFGFGPGAQNQYDRYPCGGLGEYMVAPQANLVRIPDNITTAQAARFGYLGTAYSGLKKAKIGPESSLVVLGGSGTLGLGAVLLAMGMGIGRIFAVARNRELLAQVAAIAPDRITAISLLDGEAAPRIRSDNGGHGADAVINCLGPGSDHAYLADGLNAIRRGGKFVNVGGTSGPVPIDIFRLMAAGIDILGSNWFTVAEAQEMAAMAMIGTLDLGRFEQQIYPLREVDSALRNLPDRNGGFTNFIVAPGEG